MVFSYVFKGDPDEMDFYPSAAEIAGHITVQSNEKYYFSEPYVAEL